MMVVKWKVSNALHNYPTAAPTTPSTPCAMAMCTGAAAGDNAAAIKPPKPPKNLYPLTLPFFALKTA